MAIVKAVMLSSWAIRSIVCVPVLLGRHDIRTPSPFLLGQEVIERHSEDVRRMRTPDATDAIFDDVWRQRGVLQGEDHELLADLVP